MDREQAGKTGTAIISQHSVFVQAVVREHKCLKNKECHISFE